jgi:hypothetical protein
MVLNAHNDNFIITAFSPTAPENKPISSHEVVIIISCNIVITKLKIVIYFMIIMVI